MEKKETMKTITKLYWLRTEKKDLQKRIQEIEDTLGEMTQLGSPTMNDMPKSTTRSNPMEKYVEKLISLKEKRSKLIIQSIDIEEKIEDIITKVDDAEIRTLIRSYYIDGKSWNEIARLYYKKNCDGSTPRKKVNLYLKDMQTKG